MGVVIDINSFPIKSCAPVKRQAVECEELGFKLSEFVHDRVLMITTLENQFVTARTYPKLLLIQPKVDGDQISLSTPDGSSASISLEQLQKRKPETSYVWRQPVETVDAGDEVAAWISKFILGQSEGLRLVYYPKESTMRAIHLKFKQYKNLLKSDSSALADATAYMLINQASIDDLNSRLDDVVEPLQFRPNIVVKGPDAFAEDKWNWIRIGDQVIFRNVKPCTR